MHDHPAAWQPVADAHIASPVMGAGGRGLGRFRRRGAGRDAQGVHSVLLQRRRATSMRRSSSLL